MIRVLIPVALSSQAKVDPQIHLDVEGPVTPDSILDALEARHPVLRGSIRDINTGQRRPYLRYFACERDWSHEPADAPLPEAIANGDKPFIILGAISGG